MPALTPSESRLIRAIESRRSALVDDLRRHVALPTGKGNAPALDETRAIFTQRLAALGASVTTIPGASKPQWLVGSESSPHVPPVAVCRRAASVPGARVLLCGHLDTVHDPAGDFRELSISPDGKTATGPGCVDMKGGLVIAVAALEALEEVGIPTHWGFILNSDEETGSFHSDAAIRAEAPNYDAGLVVEPALPDGSLVTSRPGSGQFMIETRGKSAHVGRDFASGVSAVTTLAETILNASRLADASRGVIVNMGPLEGGAATNIVPDRARAWGNARYPTEAVGAQVAQDLDSLATPPSLIPGVAIHRAFSRPAKPLTPQTEKLALAARQAAEDLGQRLPFGTTGGVCDGNNLQAAGLPTIDTLGVRGGGLHTTSEWIELASLVERCQLLALLIARLSHPRCPMPNA